MLYTVTRDLEKMRHLSGAYLEWDDDYSAACSKQETANVPCWPATATRCVTFYTATTGFPWG